MPISMYDASIPMFRTLLTALSGVLDKGAAFAESKKIEPSVLINDRLAPDMFPLARQVQIATDMARGGVARLAGMEVPSAPDTESTFDELKARIASTLAFIDGVPREALEGSETRDVTLKMRAGDMTFPGLRYLQWFVIPNVIFHCTTAYNILRHNGVEVGKRDFMGN
ncbi:MAG TPA: DUF1993 domain-containing protein [Acetobacteraceae bacterium]|jgi:hypothetical protein